jgi:hypothetical protein
MQHGKRETAYDNQPLRDSGKPDHAAGGITDFDGLAFSNGLEAAAKEP